MTLKVYQPATINEVLNATNYHHLSVEMEGIARMVDVSSKLRLHPVKAKLQQGTADNLTFLDLYRNCHEEDQELVSLLRLSSEASEPLSLQGHIVVCKPRNQLYIEGAKLGNLTFGSYREQT